MWRSHLLRTPSVVTLLFLGVCAACGGSTSTAAISTPPDIASSEPELWAEYVRDARFVRLRFVIVDASRDAQPLSTETADALISRHRAALLEELARQRDRFTDLPPQRFVSGIEVQVPNRQFDAHQERAESLRSRMAAGEDPYAIAAESSDVRVFAGGWGARDRYSAELRDPIFSAEVGSILPPLEFLGSSFLILHVEAEREGDVPVEDALRDLVMRGGDWLARDFLERRRAGADWTQLLAELPPERVLAESGDTGWVRWGERRWGRELSYRQRNMISAELARMSAGDPLLSEPFEVAVMPPNPPRSGSLVLEVLEVHSASSSGLTPEVRECLRQRIAATERTGVNLFLVHTDAYHTGDEEIPRCVERP